VGMELVIGTSPTAASLSSAAPIFMGGRQSDPFTTGAQHFSDPAAGCTRICDETPQYRRGAEHGNEDFAQRHPSSTPGEGYDIKGHSTGQGIVSLSLSLSAKHHSHISQTFSPLNAPLGRKDVATFKFWLRCLPTPQPRPSGDIDDDRPLPALNP
jgi:hypothetical protein